MTGTPIPTGLVHEILILSRLKSSASDAVRVDLMRHPLDTYFIVFPS